MSRAKTTKFVGCFQSKGKIGSCAKVTDFGISKMLRNVDHKAYTAMTGGVGSWLYMAPEVVRHEEYDEKVDIYSFGLIMYYLSSGRRPFYQAWKPKSFPADAIDSVACCQQPPATGCVFPEHTTGAI